MSRILANIIIAVCIQASVLGAESRASTEPSDSTIVFGVDSTATLDTYIGIALKNRSGLKSSHAKWQESLAMKGSAGALENPILSYSYGYNKFSEPVGPDRQKFGIMQPLPWLGLLGARKNAAALNADADYQSFLAEELATVYAVKSAYYEYYYVAKQLALTSESFNLMRQFEEVIRTRYQAGLAMHPDLIKAQLELGQMEEMIRSMEQMLLPAKARILALLNLPQDARLPEPIAPAISEVQFSTDSLVSVAERNSPSLSSISKQIESRQAEVSVVKKMSYPELMLGIEYERATLLNDMTFEEETMNEYMLTVQLSLPIWFGKNRAMRDAARARVRMSEFMHQEERNEIASMIAMANFEYADALRKLRLYQYGLIPKAKEALDVSITSYQSGQIDFLMLLDAQRQLFDFELTAERAKVDAATKIAELEMITGTRLVLNSNK
ncbi:MAG: TolC family protein [bacterium]|nr:TolC family protein [bacterium]